MRPAASWPCGSMSASVFGSARAIAGRWAAMLMGCGSVMADTCVDRMTHQKRANQSDDLVAGIFEHIVPRVRKRVNFCVGEAAPPLGEKLPVEDEVALAPADHHGRIAKAVQAF